MTRTFTLLALAAATLAGALAAASAAEARSISQCQAGSRSEVIKCCDQMVRLHKPLWMMTGGSSCSAAAHCSVKTVSGNSLTHASKPKKVMSCGLYPPKIKDGGGKSYDPPPKDPPPTTNDDPPPNDEPPGNPNGNPNDNPPTTGGGANGGPPATNGGPNTKP